jgi:hypothetical protein
VIEGPNRHVPRAETGVAAGRRLRPTAHSGALRGDDRWLRGSPCMAAKPQGRQNRSHPLSLTEYSWTASPLKADALTLAPVVAVGWPKRYAVT